MAKTMWFDTYRYDALSNQISKLQLRLVVQLNAFKLSFLLLLIMMLLLRKYKHLLYFLKHNTNTYVFNYVIKISDIYKNNERSMQKCLYRLNSTNQHKQYLENSSMYRLCRKYVYFYINYFWKFNTIKQCITSEKLLLNKNNQNKTKLSQHQRISKV